MADKPKDIPLADKFNIIARFFIEQKQLIRFKGSFYLYNGGIWRLESDENTEAWIYLQFQNRFTMSLKQGYIKEIAYVIRHLTYNNDDYRKKIKYFDDAKTKNTVNMDSGILDLDTMQKKEYEEKDFCFHKLSFDYKPNSQCPNMLKFLSTSMGFEWPLKEETEEWKQLIGFIQEFIGYTMIPGNPFEKALLLTGKGRNGKGTLIHIWKHILGGGYNVSTKDLHSLNNPQSIGATKNKLVNFSYDTDNSNQLDTGVIKAAVAGEPVDANDKYKEPYSFMFTAKLIIACNELPFTRSTDDNVKERFFVIPFDRKFTEEERDYNLKTNLEKEAEAIFSWAVDGLIRLRKRGKFIVPERCQARLQKYLEDNDTVAQWLDEGNFVDPASIARTKELWDDYKIFCKDSNYKGYGRNNFFNKLIGKGYEKKKDSKGNWIFTGLKPPVNSIDNNAVPF